MRDLNTIAVECMRELDAIGIQYGNILRFEVNTRAKKRWGLCKSVPGGFIISINKVLLDEKNDISGLKNTIIHELLHSCKNCMNHGEEWKRLASLVYAKYGYNIKRCSSADEKGVVAQTVSGERADQKVNYIIKCSKCGTETKRERVSDLVLRPGRYRCKFCHSRLVVIPQSELAAIKLRERLN